MLSGEATDTDFIVFGLIKPELQPTTYNTRGEHDNHFTTETISLFKDNILENWGILNNNMFLL